MLKMMKLTVLLVLVSTFTVDASNFTNKKLNCKNVPVSSLSDLKQPAEVSTHPCQLQVKHKTDLFERLRYVEECVCNLVEKEIVWESMMTNNVKTSYNALYSVIESYVAPKEPMNDMKILAYRNPFKQFGFEWASFSGSYSWEDFVKMFRSGTEAERIAEHTCKHLQSTFVPLWKFIQISAELTGNTDFEYWVAAHDHNIFKLLMTNEFICRDVRRYRTLLDIAEAI